MHTTYKTISAAYVTQIMHSPFLVFRPLEMDRGEHKLQAFVEDFLYDYVQDMKPAEPVTNHINLT